MERRKRSLTDADIEALQAVIRAEHECPFFDPETRELLKTLTALYKDGRSVLFKAFIGLVFAGSLYLAALGSGFFKWGKP